MVKLLKAIFALFHTNTCPVCDCKLLTEECICLHCLYSLPRTKNHDQANNSAEKILAGRFPFERVATFLNFNKDGMLRPIIHELKYKNNKAVGYKIGKLFGEDLLGSKFIETIDLIVPIPLHHKKLKARGYNQSEIIAQGISQATSIPVSSDNLVREIHNPSQTHLSKTKRWENVDGIFKLVNPNLYSNKHILLIDDIITTGSTIEASAKALLEADNIKISVATIGEAI